MLKELLVVAAVEGTRVTGTDDQLVPAIFSEEFYNRLQAAGGFARLVLVAGGQHGLTQKKESPDQAELEQMVVGFFAFLFRVPI